jgi:hypothetical protein
MCVFALQIVMFRLAIVIKKDYAFIIEEIGIVYMDWLFFYD